MKLIIKLLIVCLLAIIVLGFGKALAEPVEASTVPQVTRINEFNRIGWCESHGDPHAKNPNSSASGTYQWINASWYHYGKELWGEDFYAKNIWSQDNVELAWYVYTTYGTKDWDSSHNCWAVL